MNSYQSGDIVLVEWNDRVQKARFERYEPDVCNITQARLRVGFDTSDPVTVILQEARIISRDQPKHS